MSGRNASQRGVVAKTQNHTRPISLHPLIDTLSHTLSRLPSHAPFVAMKPCIDASKALRNGLIHNGYSETPLLESVRDELASSLADIESAVKKERSRLQSAIEIIRHEMEEFEECNPVLECDRFLALLAMIREYRKTGKKPSVTSATLKNATGIVLAELSGFDVNGRVPQGICEKLIQESAWWHKHPKGPVRAPNHAERLDNGMYGWQVEFGANAFLVESAVSRCVARVHAAVMMVGRGGEAEQQSALRASMESCVQRSVANFEGIEYQSAYPCHGDFMHFGSQAICVADVVQWMWNRTKAYMVSE